MLQQEAMTEADRRLRIRRNVLLLVLVALAFYFGFIYMVVMR